MMESIGEVPSRVELDDILHRDGGLVGYELGHIIQMQRFDQDRLREGVSKSGNGWNNTSDEYDAGATTEGFASYVGVVSDTVPTG
jgi:hypothetical protein